MTIKEKIVSGWRLVFSSGFYGRTETEEPVWLAKGKLDTVATKGAAGFTVLTAILTFFGIKDGLLDRILRTDPTAALWVFVLVGIGVVCALLAAVFDSSVQVYSAWVTAAVAFLAAISLALFPNVRNIGVPGVSGGLAGTAAGLLAVCLIAGVVSRFAVPLTAAVLLLGLAATCLGLYGGAKISVVSKSSPESPRLTALLDHAGTGTTVKVTVTSGQREGRPLVIVIRGTAEHDGTRDPADADSVVGRVVMVADATGQISAVETVIPVHTGRWSDLRVGYCDPRKRTDDPPFWRSIFGRQDDPPEPPVDRLCTEATDRRFKERVLLRPESAADLQVTGTLTSPAAGQLQAAMTANAIPRGTVVHTQVIRQRGAESTTFSTATLLPDGAGAASTTAAPVAVATGDVVSVCYRACPAGIECDEEWTQVASTTVLAP